MMKIFKSMVLVAQFCFAFSIAYAKEVVIGLSPFEKSETIQHTVRQSLQFAVSLNGGDTVTFVDAYHLTVIGIFKMPENKAYKSEKVRLGANKKTVGSLMQFAKHPLQDSGSNLPAVKGAVRLPQFLRYVAQNINGQRTADMNVDVIVFGSPFYDDPNDAAFSMADGLIPGDGHLQVGRDQSVFGIVGQEQLLKSVRVHFVYGDAVIQSDRHAYHIERFWQLFVTGQSGKWITFVSEASTVFKRVKANAAALPVNTTLQKTNRLEMIRLRDVKIKTSIHDRPLSTIRLIPTQLRHANNVEIGITWDCVACDLDLYVRPFSDSAILFYGHTRSDEGIYYKDFQNAPIGGFETIELTVPVDLHGVVIAVNFYSGTVKNKITGQIRLAVEGQTYALPFTIDALSGNRGGGVRAAFNQFNAVGSTVVIGNTSHTLFINPLAILG